MESKNIAVNGVIKYLEQVNQGSVQNNVAYSGIISSHVSAYRPNQNPFDNIKEEQYNETKK